MKKINKNLIAVAVGLAVIGLAIYATNGTIDILNEREALKGENQMVENGNPLDSVDLDSGAFYGDPEAPVVMVNYSNYYCPYCVRFKENVFPQLKEDYIDTGDLLYVYRDLGNPSDPIYRAPYCADDSYWEYQDLLYSRMEDFNEETLFSIADTIGLDREDFENCLSDERYMETIVSGLEEANDLGVTGTPHIIIDDVELSGLRSYEDYKQIIDIKLDENR